MSPDTDSTLTPKLVWAGHVWGALTRLQCAGILHIALRYGERREHTNAYIDAMANASWPHLGLPLQLDVTRALLELEKALGRR
jgi:hypothetical protein